MSLHNTRIEYKPSPTGRHFHEDRTSIVKAVMGPVGGGKTAMLCMEMLINAMEQQADHDEHFYPKRNGRAVRPSRWIAVRATYPQLKATLIKTFMEWTGKLGAITYDSPIRFKAELPMPDNTIIDLEVLFMALDGPRATENLRSFETTGIAISEYAEIQLDVMQMGLSRIGRFPKKIEDSEGNQLFGPTRPQIIMESNPPSSRSHWYQLFEITRPKNFRLYKQPPAMLWDNEAERWAPNPEAENIQNLPGGFKYYENIVEGSSREFINVYVANNYGTTFSGKPVFPAFTPSVHVVGAHDPQDAENFRPQPRSLIIGMDFGLNPAAVICQQSEHGGIDVFDEVVDEAVTFETFLEESLLPLLRTRFQRLPVLVIGDPAGRSRSALSMKTAYEMLMEKGIAVDAAPTNDIEPRIEAVNFFLERRGFFRVSPDCATLIEALQGGYRFAELRGKDGAYKDVPEKNEFSHVADALQYACLHLYSSSVLAEQRRKRRRRRQRKDTPATGFVWS